MAFTSSFTQKYAEIAQRKPSSLPALAAVSGVGEGKLERYGEAVLSVVQAA